MENEVTEVNQYNVLTIQNTLEPCPTFIVIPIQCAYNTEHSRTLSNLYCYTNTMCLQYRTLLNLVQPLLLYQYNVLTIQNTLEPCLTFIIIPIQCAYNTEHSRRPCSTYIAV